MNANTKESIGVRLRNYMETDINQEGIRWARYMGRAKKLFQAKSQPRQRFGRLEWTETDERHRERRIGEGQTEKILCFSYSLVHCSQVIST
ncbi:unnamed protein product [Ilex paraguariensis]|uniref:Uncharacterized protein n=1 Tax=Ilex paraguariensis TaxID=185542 RepID=A0ABC8V3T5_9AQUA